MAYRHSHVHHSNAHHHPRQPLEDAAPPQKVPRTRTGFKEMHLLRFGLERVSDTPLILRCRFCIAFGREK